MDKKRSFPFSFRTMILMLLVVVVAFLVFIFTQGQVKKTLSPLQIANERLNTQVHQLLHPTPTIIPDPVTIINEIRAVAKLETIHYTVEKIISAETSPGVLDALFGDRLLFVGHGYVIAGLDMGKITSRDLWMKDDVLQARLPGAEIFIATLDNEKSYVYDRDVGLLRNPDPDLETLARQVAEQEILNAALEDGILNQARINAEVFLQNFFNTLGYERVYFIPPDP